MEYLFYLKRNLIKLITDVYQSVTVNIVKTYADFFIVQKFIKTFNILPAIAREALFPLVTHF